MVVPKCLLRGNVGGLTTEYPGGKVSRHAGRECWQGLITEYPEAKWPRVHAGEGMVAGLTTERTQEAKHKCWVLQAREWQVVLSF